MKPLRQIASLLGTLLLLAQLLLGAARFHLPIQSILGEFTLQLRQEREAEIWRMALQRIQYPMSSQAGGPLLL